MSWLVEIHHDSCFDRRDPCRLNAVCAHMAAPPPPSPLLLYCHTEVWIRCRVGQAPEEGMFRKDHTRLDPTTATATQHGSYRLASRAEPPACLDGREECILVVVGFLLLSVISILLHLYCFLQKTLSCPRRNIRHSRAPRLLKKSASRGNNGKTKERKKYITGRALPPLLLRLEAGLGRPPPPGAPKRPRTRPPRSAKRSARPPWLVRPQTPHGQTGHECFQPHALPIYLLPHPSNMRGPGSCDQVEPGLSLAAPAPPAPVACDLTNLVA